MPKIKLSSIKNCIKTGKKAKKQKINLKVDA